MQAHGQSQGITLFTTKPLSPQDSSILISKVVRQISGIESTSRSIFRIKRLFLEILTSRVRHTLVCGDNNMSLLIALSLKLIMNSRVDVQVQFHGDIYSFNRNKSLLGFARVFSSRVGIICADSIRIVSEFQKRDISQISKAAEEKFILAPIPIDWNRIPSERMRLEIDIAFIGRFHSERGIDELLEILKLVKKAKPETRILIAGDGPLLNQIKNQMYPWIEDSTCLMPGFLDAIQIRKIYATSRILLSTAPHEGYGLTIREAALSGMRVVARRSDGVNAACFSYPNSIQTYEGIQGALELLLQEAHFESIFDADQYIKEQVTADHEGLVRLTRSWLGL